MDWRVAKQSNEVSIYFDFPPETSIKGGYEVKHLIEDDFLTNFFMLVRDVKKSITTKES